MTQFDTAKTFFDACETGQGWEACQAHCTDDASFACQADALAEVTSLQAYCDWMKGLLTPVPDGRYELKVFAMDEAQGRAIAMAEFHGTQTGEGGPVPPTGQKVVSDYAYVMEFDGDRISHMTKVWNDVQALRGLGWA